VPNEWSIDVPAIDLNYGWGDHLQLTRQGGPALLKRSGRGLVGGIGGTEAAAKWRFLDEEKSGFDMSMFPRILFNVLNSSVRRGLAEDGTRLQIPFQAAKKVGLVGLDVEFGPLISSVGGSEVIYGIVAGKELSKATSLMAEGHATSRVNLSHDVVTANFGWRHKLTERCISLGSLGHETLGRRCPRWRSSATAGCSCFTKRRQSMRFGSRLLREDQDQGDNYHGQRQRGGVTAESQPAVRDRLVEKIADHSSERASQNEGGPKQNDA
jgi:hypothetical protein